MKIAVYAICKNEEKFVNRWLASMSEADGIFVCDTGSGDNSVKLLREGGAVVNEISVNPWRFDEARNISLSFVPEEYEICVCTDLDEVFEKGWRKELEKVWQKGKTTRVRYNYIWSFNPDGTPGVSFYAEKIHSRFGFKWVHPVHEVLEYSGVLQDTYATAEGILLKHYPDESKSRAQYLELLELSVKESPEDDRNMHYLGREYMFYGRWDDCIRTLNRHLKLKSAVWADERAASMRYIARAYKAKGDFYNAKSWLYRAVAEAPYLREGYTEAALLALDTGDWAFAFHMVSEALKITDRPKSYISEAFCRDGVLYDIGSVAAFNMGLKEKALILCEKALKLSPQDERIKNNYKLISGLT